MGDGRAGMERPWEVAESCLRSVMDALLSLSGAPVTVLKPAAEGLLAAVDATALDGQSGAAGERVREAAEVLRTELVKPGRYHQGQPRAVIERLTGVTLGAVQETTLDVWGAAYGGHRWRRQVFDDGLRWPHLMVVPAGERQWGRFEPLRAALQSGGAKWPILRGR
ncbi:hypothetical protein [Streptomyces hokutonensis]|uniref:hypothetical protein n=1 Tax=Streptomyces hokutonensis TaxID=1306990 RepID=UPI0036D07F47